MKNCPDCRQEVPQAFDVCWSCSYDFATKESNVTPSELDSADSGSVKKINCLRCRTTLKLAGNINLHEGMDWGVLGDIGHMLTSKKSFNMYVCPNCDKVEFFVP